MLTRRTVRDTTDGLRHAANAAEASTNERRVRRTALA